MLAYSASLRGDWEGVESHTIRSHELNQARLAAGDKAALADVAYDLGSLAEVARRKYGDRARAVAYSEQQLALRRRLAAAEPANARMQGGLTFSLSGLARDYADLGRSADAIAAGQEALLLQRRLSAADPAYVHGARYLFTALTSLGYALDKSKQNGPACAHYREAERLLAGPLSNRPVDQDHVKQLRAALTQCAGR
jgi:tetratricopeptide (TPR) repeat protein